VSYDLDVKSRNLSAVLDILNPAHASPFVGKAGRLAFGVVAQGLKSAERGLSVLASGSSEDAADFVAGTCLLRRRFRGADDETYYQPGHVLQRRVSGTWREKLMRQIDGSAMFSPIWLVELLRGTTEAHYVRDHASGGQPGDRLAAMAAPSIATSRSAHGMTVPLLPNDVEYSVRLEERLDSDGRLVRLTATLPSGEPDEIAKE
jgi:hypothetical protein